MSKRISSRPCAQEPRRSSNFEPLQALPATTVPPAVTGCHRLSPTWAPGAEGATQGWGVWFSSLVALNPQPLA